MRTPRKPKKKSIEEIEEEAYVKSGEQEDDLDGFIATDEQVEEELQQQARKDFALEKRHKKKRQKIEDPPQQGIPPRLRKRVIVDDSDEDEDPGCEIPVDSPIMPPPVPPKENPPDELTDLESYTREILEQHSRVSQRVHQRKKRVLESDSEEEDDTDEEEQNPPAPEAAKTTPKPQPDISKYFALVSQIGALGTAAHPREKIPPHEKQHHPRAPGSQNSHPGQSRSHGKPVTQATVVASPVILMSALLSQSPNQS